MGKRRGRAGDSTPTPLYVEPVVAWLRKKRLAVPTALSDAHERRVLPDAALVDEMAWLMSLLPALKERERRSLERHAQRQQRAEAEGASVAQQLGIGGQSDSEQDGAVGPPSAAEIMDWPVGVVYSNDYVWDDAVPPCVRAKYGPTRPAGSGASGGSSKRRRPYACPRVQARRIEEERHPAFGQHGLFARVSLARGARVLDYVGRVSLGEHEDRTSDYVAEFGDRGELALDANCIGNEARFINDFRNTGRRQNVEFQLRRASDGELRQGVFVSAKEGIREGEELLISYGKPFWRARVGDLDAFITRLPGQ